MEITPIINIIDNRKALEAIRAWQEKNGIASIDNSVFEIEPYEIPCPQDCELPDNFPNCCEWHSSIYRAAKEKIDRFPDCCSSHSRLKSTTWFEKKPYIRVPDLIIHHLAYTEHCFNKFIGKDNWYKAITDYIDLVVGAFGQPPAGYGGPVCLEIYTDNLVAFVNSKEDVEPEKRQQIVSFIEAFSKVTNTQGVFNLNELLAIYKEWLQLFPFRLPFFKNLRSHYEKIRPVLKAPLEVNMYTGRAKGQLMTTQEMLKFLVSLTEDLLKLVDTGQMITNYSIHEAQKITIDIIKAKHGVNQKLLLSEYFKGSIVDFQVIQKWLLNEQMFFQDMIPAIAAAHHLLQDHKESGSNQDFKFTNNFDAIDEKTVIAFFNDHLVKKKHLTVSELQAYLVAAFETKVPTSEKFVLKHVHQKQDIIRIFYKYYKDVAGKPHGKQALYAALLGEYFREYKTENVRTNFNK